MTDELPPCALYALLNKIVFRPTIVAVSRLLGLSSIYVMFSGSVLLRLSAYPHKLPFGEWYDFLGSHQHLSSEIYILYNKVLSPFKFLDHYN